MPFVAKQAPGLKSGIRLLPGLQGTCSACLQPSVFSAVKQEGCSRLFLRSVWVEIQSNIGGKGAGDALVISNVMSVIPKAFPQIGSH